MLPTIQELQALEQVDCPLIHNFSDGIYARSIFMPKGTFVIGKKHLTEHFNMVMSGSAKLWMDGEVTHVQAPDVINSKAGCRKALIILEDMWWTTIHKTDKTDVKEIENDIISQELPDNLENIKKELECLGHIQQ